ncbi:MAG: hypothetical protein M3Q29_25545 [Chloroflexota bacterium]|nr:hypothetical protein [Chloroflexota bacterium]
MARREPRHGFLFWVVTTLTLVATVLSLAPALSPAPAYAVGNIEGMDGHNHEADIDRRAGSVAPTSAQKTAASALGASVRWNKFGTPQSLIRYGGYLGTRPAGETAQQAALNWLNANKALFGLTSFTGLQFVNDSVFRESRGITETGHTVIFRQTFPRTNLPALVSTHEGMVTIGIVGTRVGGWKVAYVSSSVTKNTALAAQKQISERQAWLTAAASIGRTVSLSAVSAARFDRRTGWTRFTVPGFSQPQRARLVALPTPTSGVRPAYETIVLDVNGDTGEAEAFTVFVDAATNKVLLRTNNVQQFAQLAAPTTTTFQGTYTPTSCGTSHTFAVPTGQKSVVVVASAALATNDIVLNLTTPTGQKFSSDTLTSPEAVTYETATGVPAGTYRVSVCPYDSASSIPPYNYAGTFTYSDQSTSTFAYPPKWQYFRTNPNANYATADTRPVTRAR